MNAPEEVEIVTPDPTPEVTEITVEQERQNIVTAAMRRAVVANAEADTASAEFNALNPTPAEIRNALATWVIQ